MYLQFKKIILIILKNAIVIECSAFLFAKSDSPNLESIV